MELWWKERGVLLKIHQWRRVSERDQLQTLQGHGTRFNAGLTGEQRNSEGKDGTDLTLEGREAQSSTTERQIDEAKTNTQTK